MAWFFDIFFVTSDEWQAGTADYADWDPVIHLGRLLYSAEGWELSKVHISGRLGTLGDICFETSVSSFKWSSFKEGRVCHRGTENTEGILKLEGRGRERG